MLSRTAEHAIRAVLLLARQSNGDALSAEQIATTLGAPRNYLGKTLNTLVKHGLLHSVRGPHGGFTLAVSADDISVADIADLFTEQNASPRTCIMGNRPCNSENPCISHARWADVTGQARAPLMHTKISELCIASKPLVSDAPVADHTAANVFEVGRNPIPTGIKS